MIHIVTNSLGSGDWIYIKKGDEVLFEGHRPTIRDISFMLEILGHETDIVEITDEQMELGFEL